MTELAIIKPAATLTAPIARPQEILRYHDEVAAYIKSCLKEGVDYGLVPKAKKMSLFKAGAERMCIAFGCHVQYELVEQEIDHNFGPNKYNDYYKRPQESFGLYRYVYKARIIRNSDNSVIGECDAVCSTMESQYISRPRDCENTAAKMAQKRAFVGAVLHAFGLSDRFTQDVEDYTPDEETGENQSKSPSYEKKSSGNKAPPPPPPPPAPETFDVASPVHLKRLGEYLEHCGKSHLLEPVAMGMNGLTITSKNLNVTIAQAEADIAAAKAAPMEASA